MTKKKYRKQGKSSSDLSQRITESIILSTAPYYLQGAQPQVIGSALIRALETFVTMQMGMAHALGNAPDDILGMPVEVKDVVAKCMDRCVKEYLDNPNWMTEVREILGG